MSESTVIYDLVRKVQPERSGGVLGFALSFLGPSEAQEHLFKVVRPDGRETITVYAKVQQATWSNGQAYFPDLNGAQAHDRSLALQRIVNDLEREGCRCTQDQIALFMSARIPNLVLSKHRKSASNRRS